MLAKILFSSISFFSAVFYNICLYPPQNKLLLMMSNFAHFVCFIFFFFLVLLILKKLIIWSLVSPMH